MTTPKVVSGFTLIPVAYSRSTHIVYAREHLSSKSTDSTFPSARTLFLVNVPVDATERELSLFFKYAGTVERVIFNRDEQGGQEVQEGDSSSSGEDDEAASSSMDVDGPEATDAQPRKSRKGKKDKKDEPAPPSVVPLPTVLLRTLRKTGAVAHLIFLDSSSLAKALAPTPIVRPWPSSEEPRGLAHYRALCGAQHPPLDIVKAHADSSVELYEFELAKSKRKSVYRKGEAIVDEDGFTLVTRGGAYGQTVGGGVSVASKQFHSTGHTGSKKKKEPKEKASFYAFQKAEKQRKTIMNLKKSFEADKARIEKMKESRRFKPY
ncbi:ribosomal RNA-processing protein 7-domain-containing protein [Scleroderma citrinum]